MAPLPVARSALPMLALPPALDTMNCEPFCLKMIGVPAIVVIVKTPPPSMIRVRNSSAWMMRGTIIARSFEASWDAGIAMMAARVSAGNCAKAESRGANSVMVLCGLAMAEENPARCNSLRMAENSDNCANAAPIWAGSTPWVVGAFCMALSSMRWLHPVSVTNAISTSSWGDGEGMPSTSIAFLMYRNPQQRLLLYRTHDSSDEPIG